MHLTHIAALGLASMALLPPSRADVLEVGPLAPYATVFDAVAVAADGDVILVAPGTYGYFGVFGKALTIVADGPGVRVEGQVRVQNTSAAQYVHLVGIEIEGDQTPALTGINAAGPVRVQGCRLRGGAGPIDVREALEVTRADDLVLIDCAIPPSWGYCVPVPGTGGDYDCSGGDAGIKVLDSYVLLDACTVYGGYGLEYESTNMAGDGAPAVIQQRSSLLVRASRVHGGSAGGCPCLTWTFGVGAPAVTSDAASTVTELDSTITGGITWLNNSTAPPFGGAGAVVHWLGDAPEVMAPSVVREGTIARFDFDQAPSTRVDLLVSLHDTRVPIPAALGDLLVGGPYLRHRYVAGTTDGNGHLSWDWTAPELPHGESAVLRWQSAHVDAGGSFVLGRVHLMTVLDSVY